MGSVSIVHSGWLQKMPHATHTFSKCRRRWFVLRTKDEKYLLEYFNEPSSTKAKGSIDLSQCKSVTPEGETRSKHFSFILKTSERQYNLSTDSFDDYKTWISRISDAGGVPNPLPQAKRTPAPLKIPPQESGGSLSSGPRTSDSKETSPYIPISECRTGTKWNPERTSPDPIMDEMRRMEMNNNLAARPPAPTRDVHQQQFNYDVPRPDVGAYSVPKPVESGAYSVPRSISLDQTYSTPKPPIPVDILAKSPPPPPPAAVAAPGMVPEIRTDHYLVPTNNGFVGQRQETLGADAMAYDQVPTPVGVQDAPPRPPKPPGLRSDSIVDDGAYDIPTCQDGGAGRIYGNARETGGGFIGDPVDLIKAVPPAVNRTLKPRKQPSEPVTPPHNTATNSAPRRAASNATAAVAAVVAAAAATAATSGSTPPPVPTRNNAAQHFFPHDFRKPSGACGESSLPDGDEPELQYLDLGNGEPSTPSPRTPHPQSQQAPPTAAQLAQAATEYKEVDFVRTKALNEMRQTHKKIYRAQLEEFVD